MIEFHVCFNEEFSEINTKIEVSLRRIFYGFLSYLTILSQPHAAQTYSAECKEKIIIDDLSVYV